MNFISKLATKSSSLLHRRMAIIIPLITVIFCILLIVFSFLPHQTVFAQTSLITQSKGLTLSPLRSELEIPPGTSLNGTLTITNSSKNLITVDLNAEAFSVVNQQYDYAFTEESDVIKWISFDNSAISLAAGQSQKVKFTVGVPLSAEPGGRYISLFASTNTGTTTNGLSSRQRIASLLYITVSGDVTREGHLVSLSAPWLVGDKADWSVALQNKGSTHYRSRYDVAIKNIIDNGVVATSQGEALIMPGTVRSVVDTLPLPQWPGIYRAEFTIGLGDNPAKVETRYILYMPQAMIIGLGAIILFLLLWLYRNKVFKKS